MKIGSPLQKYVEKSSMPLNFKQAYLTHRPLYCVQEMEVLKMTVQANAT